MLLFIAYVVIYYVATYKEGCEKGSFQLDAIY